MAQEELNWFQKSRCKWLQWGNKNTAFFHASTIVKHKRQQIHSLKDTEGRWIEGVEDLKCMARNYYVSLYTKDPSVADSRGWCSNFPELGQSTLANLARPVERDEIKRAVFEMGAFKAPGPDGIQAHFIQNQWHIVGDKICALVEEAFQRPHRIAAINRTRVVREPHSPLL